MQASNTVIKKNFAWLSGKQMSENGRVCPLPPSSESSDDEKVRWYAFVNTELGGFLRSAHAAIVLGGEIPEMPGHLAALMRAR